MTETFNTMFNSSSDIKYLYLVFDFKGNVSNILLLRNTFVDCGDSFFFFWSPGMVRRILVPQPRIEPGSLLVKVQRPNHWAAREFPRKCSCFVFLKNNVDFHGSPVVKTLPFQCRGCSFHPWLGNWDPINWPKQKVKKKDICCRFLIYSCLYHLRKLSSFQFLSGIAIEFYQMLYFSLPILLLCVSSPSLFFGIKSIT